MTITEECHEEGVWEIIKNKLMRQINYSMNAWNVALWATSEFRKWENKWDSMRENVKPRGQIEGRMRYDEKEEGRICIIAGMWNWCPLA